MFEEDTEFDSVDPGEVVCPACFQAFRVPVPEPGETPTEIDYDCEVCCRPMVVAFFFVDGELFSEARGLGD